MLFVYINHLKFDLMQYTFSSYLFWLGCQKYYLNMFTIFSVFEICINRAVFRGMLSNPPKWNQRRFSTSCTKSIQCNPTMILFTKKTKKKHTCFTVTHKPASVIISTFMNSNPLLPLCPQQEEKNDINFHIHFLKYSIYFLCYCFLAAAWEQLEHRWRHST